MSATPVNTPATPGDEDFLETREWLDALGAVIQARGPQRAHELLEQLLEEARQHSVDMPFSANTGYVNTIEPDDEERSPGNLELEGRLRAYMRWNAMAMVVKANRLNPEDGGDLGDTSVPSPRSRTCSLRVSTTSGTPRARTVVGTCSMFRATAPRGSTPALSWRAG
jgi:hypothetical protein